MGRLPISLLETLCPEEAWTRSELVGLPANGDAGIEDYYHYKAEKVALAKHLFVDQREAELMLAYPAPDIQNQAIFERFFESPSVVAGNSRFEGLFAIDITAYRNQASHPLFIRLLSYIVGNPNIVFLLFLYTDNEQEMSALESQLNQFSDFRASRLALPDANTLTRYALDRIRDFAEHITVPAQKRLKAYFDQNRLGYDAADYLAQALNRAGFEGGLPALETTLSQADAVIQGRGASRFGY